jgi:hypothetical protein
VLDDVSVKCLQILIRLCKNISKIFHEADIPVFLFWSYCLGQFDYFGIFNSPNVAFHYFLFLIFDGIFFRSGELLRMTAHTQQYNRASSDRVEGCNDGTFAIEIRDFGRAQ